MTFNAETIVNKKEISGIFEGKKIPKLFLSQT